ncbi:MAG TPA: SUF system NifU family Fe-S cluster assembly protein [Polyangiaceae bacterium]|nr:SUF system NifU family Fe-S cluster assembly protein [Polyangiaceae bacterium]
MSDLSQLYQEQILDHHRAPRNAGRVSNPTHAAEAHNPLCGDRVRLSLRVGELPQAGRGVLEARCDAQGCALCRASGSMLTELVAGHSLQQVAAWLARFIELASAAPGSEPGEDAQDAALLAAVAPLLEVRKFPSRRRCITLSWEALRTALASGAGHDPSAQREERGE